MNIHQVLIFCFFSALCGGRFGLVRAKPNIYMGAEGGNGTINCHLSLSGSWRFFCREECKGDDLLIKTDGNGASSGRYNLQYKPGSGGRGIVSVTITNLTQSDSAKYRCGLGKSVAPDSFSDFEVRVSNELDVNSGFTKIFLKGENIRYPCLDSADRSTIFLCRGECKKEEDILIETDTGGAQSGRYHIEYRKGSPLGLYVNITKVTKSDTGQYTCGYGKPLSSQTFRKESIIVVDAPVTSKPNQMLTTFPTIVLPASTPPSPTTQRLSFTVSPSSAPTTSKQNQVSTKPPLPTTQRLTPFASFSGTTEKPAATDLLMYVGVPLVTVVMLALAVLIVYIKRKAKPCDLKTRGNSDTADMETVLNEKHPPVSTYKDYSNQGSGPSLSNHLNLI